MRLALTFALLLAAAPSARGQHLEALANDPARFLATAGTALHWNEPTEPTRIVGPLYFVGTRGLAVWLITTSEGHILLNTAMPGSETMIAASMRTLGFEPADVEILLAGHAHIDHVGAHAAIRKLSGARIAMIAEEVDLIQSGGRLDFHYGKYPELAFDPVTVDRVFRDGDTITLGGVTLTARLTPGHTKGSTTFVMNLVDGDKTWVVVFPNGTSINPGYRLVKNPSYPGIADDYRRTFQVLDALQPDIWLDAHTEVFDFEAKRARAARDGVAAWVDPEGYRTWLRRVRDKFDRTVGATLHAPAKKD